MILIVVCTILIGFALLILVYLLPTEPMKENLQRSVEELYGEGDWPMLINGYSSSTLDNFTDSFMLSIAVYDNEEPVWIRAMKNYYASLSTEHLPTESFYAYLQGEECYGENYGRYWHGYLVVLKPLLLLFSYSDLRMLNTIALCFLTAYVFYLLEKELFKSAGIGFLAATIFLMPTTLFFCLDMANMFYVTLGALIILLRKKEYWKREHNVLYFFLVVGMITSYMDFLTYPMITLGIPLVTFVALYACDEKCTLKVSSSIMNVVFWGAGYGIMWSSKWILASLISGENILLNALRQVKTRSGLRETENGVLSRFDAVWANCKVLTQGVYGKILFVVLLLVLISCIRSVYQYHIKIQWSCMMAIFLVSAIPLGWLFVTSEHASLHSWFTYRNLTVSIYAISMLPLCARKIESTKIEK